MKRTVSIMFSAMLIVTLLLIPESSASALRSTNSDLTNLNSVSFYSPEYEDAYIITETIKPTELQESLSSARLSAPNLVHAVSQNTKIQSLINDDTKDIALVASATVFVSETYETIDDELVITSSRLLTKEEVDAIGEDNFNVRKTSTNRDIPLTGNENNKGKLTIVILCYENYRTNTSSQYFLVGVAIWDGFYILPFDSRQPANGEDFIGFIWGGNFSPSDTQCNVRNTLGTTTDGTLVCAVPNIARAWSFNELLPAGDMDYFADQIDIGATLTKNQLEGRGNTTEAVLQYIHTYSAVKGSISVSVSPENLSPGFSLSGCDKQWSIACPIGNLYY